MNFVKWREYIVTVIAAVLLALFVRNFVLTAYKVPTGSMQPTLKPGDFIFSTRFSYSLKLPLSDKSFIVSQPARGDVVVFYYSDRPEVSYVKRVVALPGDRVEIKAGRLIINNETLQYGLREKDSDNPNSDAFDVFTESDGQSLRRVIFEKSAAINSSKNFGPIVVPPGEVFVLGDNRDASDDSRYWGTVPTSQLIGKVQFIWLSLDTQKKVAGSFYPGMRWERLFSVVH